MTGLKEHQPLWKRRDRREFERGPGRSRVPAPGPRPAPLPPLAAAVLAALIVLGVGRAMRDFFSYTPAPAAPSGLQICVSESFGARPLSDLIMNFFALSGVSSVRTAFDAGTGVHVYEAQSAGSGRPLRVAFEDEDSTAALDHLADRGCQVAIVSRVMNPLESARFHAAPLATMIALDGAVVVVNPRSAVRSLTLDELRAAFSGDLRNWEAVTNVAAPVRVVLPFRGSDELSLFASLALAGQLPAAPYERAADVALEVSAPRAPGAIGLTTFHQSDPARAVAVIDAAGREYAPSTLSIARRTYPLTMPVFAYADPGAMSTTAYRFLMYLGSTDGQSVLVGDGFVSPSEL